MGSMFFPQNIMKTYPFSFGSGFNNHAECIAAYGDKLYIGGAFTSYNGTTSNYIISLNLDGSINTEFNIGTGFNNTVHNIRIIGDKIWVMGAFSTYKGSSRGRVVCLNIDGSEDTTVSLGAGAGNGIIYDMVVVGGYYHFGGSFTTFKGVTHYYIARVDGSGNIDLGTSGYPFYSGLGTYSFVDTVYSLATDGTHILVGGGGLNNGTRNIHALLSTGRYSTTWLTGAGFNSGSTVKTLYVNGDRLYVGGNFTTYKGVSCSRGLIYLSMADGSKPTQSYPGVGSTDTGPDCFLMASNAYFYVFGNVSSLGGTTVGKIAAIDPFTEVLWSTFQTNAGTGFAQAYVSAVEIADRLYVVGYRPSSYNGATNYVYGIARLKMDGTLDA